MTAQALRSAALVGVALIFIGLFVSSTWGMADFNPDSSWLPYIRAWIGVILLVIVVAIGLRAAESARWKSVEDVPLLAMGGVIGVLVSLFLFGGVISALGGITHILGALMAGSQGSSPTGGENQE